MRRLHLIIMRGKNHAAEMSEGQPSNSSHTRWPVRHKQYRHRDRVFSVGLQAGKEGFIQLHLHRTCGTSGTGKSSSAESMLSEVHEEKDSNCFEDQCSGTSAIHRGEGAELIRRRHGRAFRRRRVGLRGCRRSDARAFETRPAIRGGGRG
jgi:hypothetical protein